MNFKKTKKVNEIFEFGSFLLLYFLTKADSEKGESSLQKCSCAPSHAVTYERCSTCSVDFVKHSA